MAEVLARGKSGSRSGNPGVEPLWVRDGFDLGRLAFAGDLASDASEKFADLLEVK